MILIVLVHLLNLQVTLFISGLPIPSTVIPYLCQPHIYAVSLIGTVHLSRASRCIVDFTTYKSGKDYKFL